MVAIALHQVGEVLDHVVATRDEVLAVVGTPDGRLVLDHQAHLVGDVEHVRRRGDLVDPDVVVVEPQVVVDGLRPSGVARRRLEEAGEGVVGIADAVIVDVVEVGPLDAVAAEVDPATVELEVVTHLAELAEPEPHVRAGGLHGRRARVEPDVELVQLGPGHTTVTGCLTTASKK